MNLQNILENKINCPCCDFEASTYDELEAHMVENHFMTIENFLEREPRNKEEGYCWKCNKFLSPLTFLNLDACDYNLPCWNCMSKKYEISQAIQTTQGAIHDYYGQVLGDRYFQMFIIDDIYPETTITHEFGEFKKVLKLLQPKDRNKLWLIDYIPGYPKTICSENVEGLKIVSIDDQYRTISKKATLMMKDYEVEYPSIVPYDSRHHSRYNILNTSDNNKSKRLRLSPSDGKSSKCIKFFNGSDPRIKSLFRIRRHSTGEEIDPTSLTRSDYIILKLVLMRNKTFTKLLVDMLEEFSLVSGIIRDGIFLRNTVKVDPNNRTCVNISWLPEYKDGYINISVL